MSDPASSSTAWPPARPIGIAPIQHPAWERARNTILDRAAEGPVTVMLVGESGTGKTWLLRELASALGDHGFPTMMLMQGDLPMTLSDGAVLLVDEALRMNASMRAEMSAQRHGVAVLADLEPFEDDLPSSNRVVVRLRSLGLGEVRDFASEWLRRSSAPALVADASALSRLALHSGGKVRLIAQLLGAATSMCQASGRSRVTGADIDRIAELRFGGLATAPAAEPENEDVPPVPAHPRRRWIAFRPVLAGSAIAACIVLGWAMMPWPVPTKTTQRAEPVTQPAQTVVAAVLPPPPVAPVATSLPPLENADTPDPALVITSNPVQLGLAAPLLAALPPPELDANAILPGSEPAVPPATIASALPPPVLGATEPGTLIVAKLDDSVSTATSAAPPSSPPQRRGSAGLVLVAQRGDTLESLYGSVYRDRKAPPFATVVAANPGPFKPGAIVMFPEPPGGWQRTQR